MIFFLIFADENNLLKSHGHVFVMFFFFILQDMAPQLRKGDDVFGSSEYYSSFTTDVSTHAALMIVASLKSHTPY